MSQKELKGYLGELSKEQLEEQILDLYKKFKPVKTYYDFAFRPNEEKRIEEAKLRIGKEYFPINGRKAKIRPSIAQKFIRHFKQLDLDPFMLSDLMLFNIETAQAYRAENRINREAWYKSMLNSYDEAAEFIRIHQLRSEFMLRMERIVEINFEQEWPNAKSFRLILETLKER